MPITPIFIDKSVRGKSVRGNSAANLSYPQLSIFDDDGRLQLFIPVRLKGNYHDITTSG